MLAINSNKKEMRKICRHGQRAIKYAEFYHAISRRGFAEWGQLRSKKIYNASA